jgi:acylpyruvate hydrolase
MFEIPEPNAVSTVSLLGSSHTVAVGKILCVGRNYAKHVREMKADLPSSPVLFLKPATAVLGSGSTVVIPEISSDMHHEVEMTVLIGRGGKNIPAAEALKHVMGYGVGLDMTLRDVQSEAKKGGLPWTLAKAFDTSAPLSAFVPRERIPAPERLGVRLSCNGTIRQTGWTRDFIFTLADLIAYMSRFFTLEPGDVLFTGTPEGVGRVQPHDTLAAELLDETGGVLTSLSVTIEGVPRS